MSAFDCLIFAAVGGVIATIAASAMGHRALARALTLLTALAYAALSLWYALHGDVIGAVACAAVAVFWVRLWWKGPRGRRRKSLRELGHKARARLAAILRSMPKPGPVLRPAPQGARA